MSYRIADLKETFEIYVLKCEAVFNLKDKIEVHGETHTVSWLLDHLKSCDHEIPMALCEYMEFNHGTTYTEAVQKILKDRNNL